MSILFEQKYKIFLIYFSGKKWQNCAVHICTVLDTLHALQRPAQSRSARRGRFVLVFWHGLPCCLCCAVVPGALGPGPPPRGMGPEARVGVVSPVSSDQNKKGAFIANTHPTFTNQTPSDCASLQIFRKIQKGPFPGLICAILDRKKGAL